MRIKICGITNVEDAQAAAAAGADAIGLNFVGGPRRIDAGQARDILTAIPPLIMPIALVPLESGRVRDALLELLGEFWVSHLQLYGDLSQATLAELCADGFRPMPVVHVAGPDFYLRQDHLGRPDTPPSGAAAVVLDAYDPQRLGGTGMAFRWDWVVQARGAGGLRDWPPIILAGGLNADNVAEAIRLVQPYGVDVSSGVEVPGKPGRKDAGKMRAFVRNARAACTAEE